MAEKINSFYKQGTTVVRPDLFNEYAEKVAKSFASVSSFVDKNGKERESRKGVSSTQIRRLFDEVKRYERLIDDEDEASWNKQLPYIKMTKSKIHYAVARAKKKAKDNEAKYYDNLAAFLSEGIDLIKSVTDYHVFTSLFEAVYGFYYENRPDLKN